jgi:calcium-independent phospholipase A2-gamma
VANIPWCSFVVAMTDEARSIVTFTDYKKRFGGDDSIYDDAKIWEVARATSAASSFFDPMPIKRNKMERVFLDGGLGSNNPVDELWQEATDEWGPAPLAPQIRCLLSIGTGKPRLEVFGTSLKAVADTIIKIATETQKTADKFERNQAQLFNEDHAFRFNPPDIDVGLEDAEQKGRIAARTENYTNEAEFRRRLERFMEAAGEEQSASMQDHLVLLQYT